MIPTTLSCDFFGPRLENRPHPIHGQWELTCRCNLHCVMCYTDPFNTPSKIRRELTTAEVLKILDEVVEEGCLELIFTGGEPLARRDFFEIYETAHQSGLLVTVFSNGTLIDEKTADRFALHPPEGIEISLHGVSRGVFEEVTLGEGSFHKCLRAIDLLLERKIPLTLKTTAMTLNLEEIAAIKNYVERLKAKGDVQYRLGEEMRARLDGRIDPGRFQLPEEELKKLETILPPLAKAHAEQEAMLQDPYPCRSGQNKFHIDAYGQLQLCSGNRRNSYDLKKGSFKEGFYKALPGFYCPRKRP